MAHPLHCCAVRALPAALLCLLGVGCGRPLEEGRYAFAVQSVVRDTCALALQTDVVSGGEFENSGLQVIFVLPVGRTPLFGWYRDGEDSFYADGTATNLTLQAGPKSCFIEAARVSLEGLATSTRTFTGALSLQANPLQQPECACALDYAFTATRTEDP